MFRRRRPQRAATPTVLQLEAAECGAASLAMVLARHGRHVPLEELRNLCGVSRDGAKASSLVKAGRTFGLQSRGVKVGMEGLAGLPVPFIAFVDFNHFLVVEGLRGDTVFLNDPASGRRRVDLKAFSDSFTGVALTFEPGPDFRKGDSRPSLTRSLAARLDGYRPALLFVLLVSVTLVVPGVITPLLSRLLVDYVLVRGLEDWLPALLGGMAATAAVRWVLLELRGQTLVRLDHAMTLRSGERLFEALLRLPVRFFDQRFAGEVADRLRLNERLVALLTERLVEAVVATLSALFFALAMAFYAPRLTLAVVLLALVNAVVLAGSTRVISERYRRISIDEGKLQGSRVAALQDMETFKASGAEDIVFGRWLGMQTTVVNGRQAAARLSNWISPLPALLNALIAATVLVGGGHLVMQGELTLGMLVALQSLSASFAQPVAQLAGFGAELQQVRSYTQRLDEVLDHAPDPRFAAAAADGDGRLPRGAVTLESVCFGYAPLDPPLIAELSLEIAPGRRVALVGGSGSGKSTLGKLIAGLELPRSGRVLLDGRPPHEWPRRAFAARFAYVGQDISLFEGSVRENLSLWDETLPEPALVAAAHDAEVHATVSMRPGGYDARLSDGGRNFSGGERQRLEIARALATDPAVLVLDEATSALDPLTEQAVMQAIRRRGVTCIVIAHRLSTVRDCDEIIVLDQGVAVERGTHERLLAAGGLYASLVET